jgi:hypothetical protein
MRQTTGATAAVAIEPRLAFDTESDCADPGSCPAGFGWDFLPATDMRG